MINNSAGARFVEIYNVSDSDVDLTGWELRRWTNGNASPQGTGVDLSPIGTLSSGSFALIAANATEFETVYGITADVNAGTGGAADSNGDDQIAIFDDTDQTIDIFGVPGEDGSGTCHEFEDGRAERVSSVSASSATWIETEWNVWADSSVSGCTNHTNSPRSAPTDYDPGVWIGDTSSGPGITLGAVSGNTSEDGTTATFTAVLDIAPTSNVVLDVSSDYPGEVSFDLSQLTFTDQNWDTPQTITITGLDDSDEDGDIDVTITVAVDDALSDAAYAGLSETTTVTNEDDDFPNIVITEFMYNTPGTDDEWIELYNSNGSDVDISTWTLNVGTNTFTFPPSTNFPNNTYITIAMGSNGDGTFNNDNPFTPDYSNVSDPLESTNDTNNMSNGAATITLENIASTIIDSVAYDDGDVSSTDGSGPSYEIIDTTADNSTTASNWQASIFNGGTPGNT